MAQPAVPPPAFDELSPDEKLGYIQALWDHFSEHPEEVPVPNWHHQIVAERVPGYGPGSETSIARSGERGGKVLKNSSPKGGKVLKNLTPEGGKVLRKSSGKGPYVLRTDSDG
jgi:hypothetical protein